MGESIERSRREGAARRRAAGGSRLGKVWVDGGYQAGAVEWARAELGSDPEVVARPPGTQGVAVLPRRRVAERSWA